MKLTIEINTTSLTDLTDALGLIRTFFPATIDAMAREAVANNPSPDRKIPAIKSLRETYFTITGQHLSLLEAKNAIEAVFTP